MCPITLQLNNYIVCPGCPAVLQWNALRNVSFCFSVIYFTVYNFFKCTRFRVNQNSMMFIYLMGSNGTCKDRKRCSFSMGNGRCGYVIIVFAGMGYGGLGSEGYFLIILLKKWIFALGGEGLHPYPTHFLNPAHDFAMLAHKSIYSAENRRRGMG